MSVEDIVSVIRASTMCGLAAACVLALCATLFCKNYADPTVLVTIVGATNLLLGYLAGKRAGQEETKTKNETQQINTV